jgi:H/ACA ribonucleoprotein complex subunit 3
MFKLRFCGQCRHYTLEEEHCGAKTRAAHPPKFSPEDKYGAYRLKARGNANARL